MRRTMAQMMAGGDTRRAFSITPAVSGKTFWDLDIDGPLRLPSAGKWTIVPVSTFVTSTKGWGAAGGNVGSNWSGGAGGSARGDVRLYKDVSYDLWVGAPGVTGTSTGAPGGAPGGGRGSLGSFVGASGGGYSGILRTVGQQPVLIAAAGAGGGYGGNGGAGGGLVGQDGAPYGTRSQGTGASQSAAGQVLDGTSPLNQGSYLQGGNAEGDYGGAGGGGLYGGGGGRRTDAGGAGGGGGGSSYAHPTDVTNAVLEGGSGTVPGNSSDADRGGAGGPNAPGRLNLS